VKFVKMSLEANGEDEDEEEVCSCSEISETTPSFVQNTECSEHVGCRQDCILMWVRWINITSNYL
jgi:hypothetical protein